MTKVERLIKNINSLKSQRESYYEKFGFTRDYFYYEQYLNLGIKIGELTNYLNQMIESEMK